MKRQLIALLACTAAVLAWGAGTAAAEDPSAQAADQSAQSGQAAGAASGAAQSVPSNQNIAVRVLSPGDDGDVTQANTVSSAASATNVSGTSQSAGQTQAGPGVQVAGQQATTAQLAAALSAADQSGASNTNLSVRVLSPGDDGSVTQWNGVSSGATAANAALTAQDANQNQAGGGGCPCLHSDGVQTADQSASTSQAAAAKSTAQQTGATNTNVSVRVLSPGNDGAVTQANTVASAANAANAAATKQNANQQQAGPGGAACCAPGTGVQTVKQVADTEQKAAAVSSAMQQGATNTNIAVRVLSPGNGGDVNQWNGVSSSATAGNLSTTDQNAGQTQAGGSGSGVQMTSQAAGTQQAALAGSHAVQTGASNLNLPVRVGSPGNDGNVSQSNTVASTAVAGNFAATLQDAHQWQGPGYGHGCCPGAAVQTVDQQAKTSQAALAESKALQELDGKHSCGCPAGGNTNMPVRVHSPGDDGHVSQANSVSSTAAALNAAATKQGASQAQSTGGGTGVQVLGQQAATHQLAGAASAALQLGAANRNEPVRVWSPGGGGSVAQSNVASSAALAANAAKTEQSGRQAQHAGGVKECCPGIAIQALGQLAGTAQAASARSYALQAGGNGHCGCPSGGNVNAPVRVHSAGGGGSVQQWNAVASAAKAANLAVTDQDASQHQAGGGLLIQALGQAAASFQAGAALSAAGQLGPAKGVMGH